MKCEKCGKPTRVNWGDASVILCEKHAHLKGVFETRIRKNKKSNNEEFRNLPLIIIAFFSILSVGGITIFAKNIEHIIPPIAKAVVRLFKDPVPEFIREGKVLVELVNRNIDKNILINDTYGNDIFDILKLTEMPTQPLPRVCLKYEWREIVRKKLQESEIFIDAYRSGKESDYLQGKLEIELSKRTKKEIASLSVLSVYADLASNKLTLEVKTPCGSQRYIAQNEWSVRLLSNF